MPRAATMRGMTRALDGSLDAATPVLGAWGNSPRTTEIYGDLTDWLGERLEHLAVDATDRIWADIESYRASELHDDVLAHVSKIFGVFVTTVREGRDPSVDDFHWTAEHAQRRVDHGISLVDFLKAFRIAQLTMWEHVLAWAAESRPDAERAALNLVSHLMRTIEAGSSMAARTYLEAQQYDLADLENVQRALIEALLAGRRTTRARHLAMLRDAGLGDDQPFTVAAGVLTEAVPDVAQEILARSARTHLSLTAGGLYAVREAELVAVLPLRRNDERALRQRLAKLVDELAGRGIHLRVGLGASRTNLAVTGEAHAEALLARDSIDAPSGIVAVSDLSTLDYLLRRPDDTVMRLVRPQVRAFFTEDLATDGTYAHSLRAYIDHDLNAREAARSLHVHVNTMYYRLERIAERTGCDLRRIDEVIELLLAVRMLSAR